MKCCSSCTAVVQRFAGPIEEKSGPGAIIGKYRCFICRKGFDVREDHPHNLNIGGDVVGVVKRARFLAGIVVSCPACDQAADEAAGKATKTVGHAHNCGRPSW